MRKIILFSLIFFDLLNGFGQVSINTNHLPADSSAMLDVSSTSKGLLTPRLTTTARLAIAKPATGLLVFDLNYKCFFMFDGFKWMALTAVDPSEILSGNQAPSDIVSNDQFGYSTGIDSLYAIVGAPFQNDSIGAAYFYKKTNNEWVQMGKIVPDTNCIQLFGKSVSINYPYAVVGAPAYTGNKGAIYIYHCDGVTWTQTSKFQKTNVLFERPQFGYSVDIDYPMIVVGAPTANTVALGGGAVFTYKRLKPGWAYQSTLTDTSIKAGDNFGYSVAISDSFIVIGSPLHDNLSTGNIDEGMAYNFNFDTTGVWKIAERLIPFYRVYNYRGDPITLYQYIDDNWVYKKFGYSVDIKRNTDTHVGLAYDNVFTVVGAPESYFNFDGVKTALNLGLVDIYGGIGNRSYILFNKKVPDISDSNDLLGSSVSFSAYKGNLLDNTGNLDLKLLCGSPGANNGRGKISKYILDKKTTMVGYSNGSGGIIYHLIWGWDYIVTPESSYSSNSANAATGFSCSMFDSNSCITSLPGLILNQGGIIFKF